MERETELNMAKDRLGDKFRERENQAGAGGGGGEG